LVFSKEESDTLQTACGTALYVAPEVLSAAQYDTSCDIWSVGVITYILLSAHIPYDGNNEKDIFEKILKAQFYFPSALWSNISASAKKFINEIFVVDPKKRLTASDCLKHEWLADTRGYSSLALDKFREKLGSFRDSQILLKIKNTKITESGGDTEEEDEDEEDDSE